jgi:hypothetical protein
VFETPTLTARAVSSCQHPPRCNSGRGTQRTWVGNPPPETFGASASWHEDGAARYSDRHNAEFHLRLIICTIGLVEAVEAMEGEVDELVEDIDSLERRASDSVEWQGVFNRKL